MYVCTCVCVCVCVCVFLSVCIIIIINIIFFFFVFYKRPRNHFRDIVGSRDKKIEINQITKLTKREKIVSWSNRVYRSIEGDVLRSSITTGHETNPSFHSSPLNLTRTETTVSYSFLEPTFMEYFGTIIPSAEKEKNENRNYKSYDQRYADRNKKSWIRFVGSSQMNETIDFTEEPNSKKLSKLIE